MLFAYGTLQDQDVLGAVLGRRVDVARLRRATAPGFRAAIYPGRVYPALVPAVGETTRGLLVEGLSALDIAVLDAFEGDEYRRQAIALQVDGAGHMADAYLPTLPISPEVASWSLADWTRAHKPAVLGQETGLAAALRQRLAARMPG